MINYKIDKIQNNVKQYEKEGYTFEPAEPIEGAGEQRFNLVDNNGQNLGFAEALKLSTARELFDGLIKNPLKGIDLKENISDCKSDLKADLFGLLMGIKNPSKDCKSLIEKYRPNGLPLEY